MIWVWKTLKKNGTFPPGLNWALTGFLYHPTVCLRFPDSNGSKKLPMWSAAHPFWKQHEVGRGRNQLPPVLGMAINPIVGDSTAILPGSSVRDLFSGFKWPFQGLSDLHLRNQKGTWKKLVRDSLFRVWWPYPTSWSTLAQMVHPLGSYWCFRISVGSRKKMIPRNKTWMVFVFVEDLFSWSCSSFGHELLQTWVHRTLGSNGSKSFWGFEQDINFEDFSVRKKTKTSSWKFRNKPKWLVSIGWSPCLQDFPTYYQGCFPSHLGSWISWRGPEMLKNWLPSNTTSFELVHWFVTTFFFPQTAITPINSKQLGVFVVDLPKVVGTLEKIQQKNSPRMVVL